MDAVFEKIVLSVLSGLVLGLGGWVYSTGSRVSAVETAQAGVQENVQVIREDVREIRKALLGPKGP